MNFIITGYNESKKVIEDFILESKKDYILKGKKIEIINHGSGCNYSASIASSLALKRSIHDAAEYAKEYVFQSIKNSKKIIAMGGECEVIKTDVSKSNDIRNMIDYTLNKFGRIDNLIQNAFSTADNSSFGGSALEVDEENWDQGIL